MDRSSRPHRSPRRTDAAVEERICRLRRSTRRGPEYLSARTGVPASTVWRILCRSGLNRLSWIDRPTGRVIRRYERSALGQLVHLGRQEGRPDPRGGCWRVHGRGSPQARCSPAAPCGLHLTARRRRRLLARRPASRPTTTRPPRRWWSSGRGPRGGSGPTTYPWTRSSPTTARTSAPTPSPRCWPSGGSCTAAPAPTGPQTNGKAERTGRTLADEFLYNFKFRSESERRIRLKRCIHDYNCHRHHTAVGGPPASRADNLTRTDT